MSPWPRGQADIDQLLTLGYLQRVTASRAQAEAMLGQARLDADSAQAVAAANPNGALKLLEDAALTAITAILENQGLRPTTAGGHTAPYDAVKAQLQASAGGILKPFPRIRVRRNEIKYPTGTTISATPDEVTDAATKVLAIIEMAAQVLDHMPVY